MPDLSDGAPWPNGAFVGILSVWTRKINSEQFNVVAIASARNQIKLRCISSPRFYWKGTYQQLVDEFYLS